MDSGNSIVVKAWALLSIDTKPNGVLVALLLLFLITGKWHLESLRKILQILVEHDKPVKPHLTIVSDGTTTILSVIDHKKGVVVVTFVRFWMVITLSLLG